jgi:hypothetical protein
MTGTRKSRVVLLTRTNWDEPPRLRRQVAELLADHGHEVLFVQRPRGWVRGRVVQEGRVTLARQGELIHPQLRAARPASLANAAFVRWSLAPLARAWSDAAVVNFNYDYWMARDLWPRARMVTVINDDFQFQARPWARPEARWAQRRTLQASDAAVAVSYPLVRQCLEDTPNASLFIPWARRGYNAPPLGKARRDILYWGYIENRIDWALIERMAAHGIVFHFVGPIDRCPRAHVAFAKPNINYHGTAALADIGNILDRCAASILPYDLSNSSLEITMSNRAFEILGYGIPLLYAAFPELLATPEGVIRKCRTFEEYVAAWEAACTSFDAVQPGIRAFLAEHTPDARYRQLSALLG